MKILILRTIGLTYFTDALGGGGGCAPLIPENNALISPNA